MKNNDQLDLCYNQNPVSKDESQKSWESLRIETDDEEYCFYCNARVKGRKGNPRLGDHFPIPYAGGGTTTVPCCRSCHEMKDMYRLEDWPAEWISKIIEDFPNLNRETKILIAKIIKVVHEARVRKGVNAGSEPTPSD
jgi:hypothetical protein